VTSRRLSVPSLIAATVGIAATSAVSACHRAEAPKIFMDTAVVTRQPMVITVAATGTVEPAEVVQVKSKASGQIIKMPVQMGSQVKAGDLIAQIDPRDPQSRYNQAVAALSAAKANVEVTRAQRDRAEQLYAERAMTAPEHEQAVLAYANAQSQLATAQTNLEVARIQLADVTIRAPQAGTILDRQVAPGQVIASATNSVSGGTTLVTLANLQNIVDSALVTESDIGKVRSGETASVTVDAYPTKVFHGVVDKVSSQAVTIQSVTMFPVIIRLDNTSQLLKPGMNSDVSILVEQRTNALVIPNDAIGTTQDLMQAAVALGVNTDSIRELTTSRGSGSSPRGAGRGRGRGTGANAASGGGARRGTAANGTAMAAGAAPATHIDSAGGAIAGVSDTNTVPGGVAGSEPHPAVVLVLENGKWVPRRVILGIGTYDATEVISGLQPGDKVALVSEIRVQAARDSSLNRIQSRGGLPGIGGSRGGSRGGGSRGGGR
jgi:HlyD family secretion protein